MNRVLTGCLLFITLISCNNKPTNKTKNMEDNFTPAEWIAGTNVYEVNVRQYTPEGTFASFEKELPRLKDMGVQVLWFMPITPISKDMRQGSLGSYYACSDYKAINPEFGTLEDFKSLVKQAHSLGLRVVIDWVANHTGYDHVWTKQHPSFYAKDSAGQFYDRNGWIDVIDLDYTNQEMRKAMIDAMHFWVTNTGIDGFRCDMAHLVPLDFWRQARLSFKAEKKLFWFAETEEASYHEVFDATYAWQILHKLEAFAKGTSDMNGLDSVLNRYDTDFHKGSLRLFFTTNHDENSHSGSEFERMGDAAKPFAVLCATWRNSIPLIYSGQELPNKKRLLFFDKDVIEWTGTYAYHDFFKTLLQLHANHPALQAGDTSIITSRIATTSPHVFAFLRQKGKRQVMVLLNLSANNKVRFEINNDLISGTYKSSFSGVENDFTNERSFEMQAWEYLVYEK